MAEGLLGGILGGDEEEKAASARVGLLDALSGLQEATRSSLHGLDMSS
jgi:hypothetical protein